jgi:hypothetical protein
VVEAVRAFSVNGENSTPTEDPKDGGAG